MTPPEPTNTRAPRHTPYADLAAAREVEKRRLRGGLPVAAALSALIAVVLVGLFLKNTGYVGDVEVVLVNGLEESVSIVVDGQRHWLPSNEYATIEVSPGVVSFSTRDSDDELLEDIEVRVLRHVDVQFYNVLAAGPAALEYLYYSNFDNPRLDDKPTLTLFTDASWVVIDDVDYQHSNYHDRINAYDERELWVRNHFFIAPGGWRETALLLALSSPAGDGEAKAEAFIRRLGEHAGRYSLASDLATFDSLIELGTLDFDTATYASILAALRQRR